MPHAAASIRRRRPPEERRKQILEAAVRLFARQGFARTTTKEIAREAGIAEGTIYKHFASKQDLLLAFIESAAAASARALLEDPPEDDAEFVRAFLANRFAVAERQRPMLKVIFGEALFDRQLAKLLSEGFLKPILPLFERTFARRVRLGRFRSLDTRVAAGALAGQFIMFGVIWPALFPDDMGRLPARRLIEQLASIFLDGVRVRPAEGVTQ